MRRRDVFPGGRRLPHGLRVEVEVRENRVASQGLVGGAYLAVAHLRVRGGIFIRMIQLRQAAVGGAHLFLASAWRKS